MFLSKRNKLFPFSYDYKIITSVEAYLEEPYQRLDDNKLPYNINKLTKIDFFLILINKWWQKFMKQLK